MTEPVIVDHPPEYPGVQMIRFNRPEKKNAITRAMYAAMTAALASAEREDAVRVTVFLGSDGCFSAGNDMADFMAVALGGTLGGEVVDFLRALATHGKPLLSGVDGLAIGIGTTLHLHCDLTIASERSQFRTPFVDLGLVPEAGSSLLAPRLMGHQRAFALLAAGEAFSGRQAVEAGLVWKLVPPAEVAAETLRIAGALAKKPPQALRIARDLVRGDPADVLARIDAEAAHFATRLKSAEARAAFEAFLAKR